MIEKRRKQELSIDIPVFIDKKQKNRLMSTTKELKIKFCYHIGSLYGIMVKYRYIHPIL